MNKIDCHTSAKVRTEASRILQTTHLPPHGKELADVLHFSEETNQLALEAWIRDQIFRLGLPLDHAISQELDLRCAAVFLEHFPERYDLLLENARHQTSRQKPTSTRFDHAARASHQKRKAWQPPASHQTKTTTTGESA